uniref:Chromo domain-containing protein n=1 Tax=Cajanus cajan TaxID=3821 RepID=A0A151R5A1_CAJCA|nr:hypothetical protein KK1_041088 [Cajanus cajan]
MGDMVFVKLHPYRQVCVATRSNAKVAPKYFGPYKIIDKIGQVAYKVELPTSARIHNVFHVSQLKKYMGDTPTSTDLPVEPEAIPLTREPEDILDRITVKRHGRAVSKVLVKWKNQVSEDATWEYYYDLKQKYPEFNP